MSKVIEQFQQIIEGKQPGPPVADLIGFSPVEVSEGYAAFQLLTDEKHTNPMGTLHGGILGVLADSAMGSAYMTLLADGETFTTVEMKINYFKPVWKTRLVATAKVVKKGRTIGYVECDVHDEQQNLIARASSTCMTLTGKAAEGR
jgi:uncharacterized protein (TIGR00369 family)